MNYVVCPEFEATHVGFYNGVVGEIKYMSMTCQKEICYPTAEPNTEGFIAVWRAKEIGAIQAWLKVREPMTWGGKCEVLCFNEDQTCYLPIPASFRGKTVKVTIEEVGEDE